MWEKTRGWKLSETIGYENHFTELHNFFKDRLEEEGVDFTFPAEIEKPDLPLPYLDKVYYLDKAQITGLTKKKKHALLGDIHFTYSPSDFNKVGSVSFSFIGDNNSTFLIEECSPIKNPGAFDRFKNYIHVSINDVVKSFNDLTFATKKSYVFKQIIQNGFRITIQEINGSDGSKSYAITMRRHDNETNPSININKIYLGPDTRKIGALKDAFDFVDSFSGCKDFNRAVVDIHTLVYNHSQPGVNESFSLSLDPLLSAFNGIQCYKGIISNGHTSFSFMLSSKKLNQWHGYDGKTFLIFNKRMFDDFYLRTKAFLSNNCDVKHYYCKNSNTINLSHYGRNNN